jgi:formylglycine-generating enzyme required for sulfatase activity
MRTIRSGLASSLIIAIALTAAATAAPLPDYGFDFVTIGAVNNRAYEGGGFDGTAYQGRGSVSYEYRMARLEVSTGQWLEFLNTIAPLTESPDTFGVATTWGGRSVGGTPPGDFELRPVANAAMIPVIGISWRSAAMYCNWLHNGKEVSLAAIASGAYDTSTFGVDENNHFTDQITRSPGARYWIPSLDEWIKAVHFDPNAEDADHPGTGRWWEQPNGTDDPMIGGGPGEGETSANVTTLPPEEFRRWTDIPLGSYPDQETPWGLLDASGGAWEWTEEILFADAPRTRGAEGTQAGMDMVLAEQDFVWIADSFFPQLPSGGLRIASAIPAPAASVVLAVGVLALMRRRR